MPYYNLEELMKETKAILSPMADQSSIQSTIEAIIQKIRETDTEITRNFIYLIVEKNQNKPGWNQAFIYIKEVRQKLRNRIAETNDEPKPTEKFASAIKTIQIDGDLTYPLMYVYTCIGLHMRLKDLDNHSAIQKALATYSIKKLTGKTRTALFLPFHESVDYLIHTNLIPRNYLPRNHMQSSTQEEKTQTTQSIGHPVTSTKNADEIRSLMTLKKYYVSELKKNNVVDYNWLVSTEIDLDDNHDALWQCYLNMKNSNLFMRMIFYSGISYLEPADIMQPIIDCIDKSIQELSSQKEKTEANIETKSSSTQTVAVESKTESIAVPPQSVIIATVVPTQMVTTERKTESITVQPLSEIITAVAPKPAPTKKTSPTTLLLGLLVATTLGLLIAYLSGGTVPLALLIVFAWASAGSGLLWLKARFSSSKKTIEPEANTINPDKNSTSEIIPSLGKQPSFSETLKQKDDKYIETSTQYSSVFHDQMTKPIEKPITFNAVESFNLN